MDIQDSLDLLDAAREIGCHPSTLRRAIRRREIAHHRLFGRILIQRCDLEEFVERTYRPTVESPKDACAEAIARLAQERRS